MKSLVFVVLVACGGPATKPIGNTGTATAPEPTPARTEGTRVISRTQTGGVIELGDDRAKAMEDANKEMEAHCGPGNYTITQEGEEVTGDPEKRPADVAWRVHYQCAGS
jgi:hypothetical protein